MDNRMTQTLPDDEIDVLAMWSALWRRRYLLGGLALVGLAAGLAAGLMIQPVYESRAALQVGRVGGVGFVEEPVAVMNRIRQVYRVDPSLCGGPAPQLNRVEEVVPGTILVAACARSSDASATFLSNELQKVLTEHQAIFSDLLKRRTASRDAMASQIEAIEDQQRKLDERVLATASQNAAVAAILMQDRLRVTTDLFQLKDKLAAREMELSPVSTSPTRTLSESTSALPPGRWTRPALAAGGFVAGLMIGVLLALVLEWRHVRAALSRSTDA